MTAKGPKNNNALNLFLNNYFSLIILFIVIMVFIFSYAFFIKPKYDETMLAIKENTEQQEKILLNQKKKLESLKSISNLYGKINDADLKKFNGVLPDNYVKESLFGELEEIIGQNGYILNTISITKGDPVATEGGAGQKVGEVGITFSLSGINYSGFKNLLRLLENNLRLFDITQVSFSPGGNSANLTLTTYYYGE